MRSIDVVATLLRGRILTAGLLVVLSSLALPLRDAGACGCLAPPDVSQPLVQAGEEIVFAVENGKVTMHVKIRYSGRAGDFGWLLPLPSVPVDSMGVQGFDVGVDELFAQLETRTQPTYILQRYPCSRRNGLPSIGCGASEASADFGESNPKSEAMTPLVKQSTVGPYDYAILKADDKAAMLQWLSMYRYVVPAGTDTAINAYIRPGAYLLALRLTAGAQVGDLQPVVLSYPADLPMIPIVLTSVGASPNMGVLIWVLGDGRAIPRNYAHTVINDAQLDWLNQVKNYNDVITRAVGEAPGKHAFVTEYADTPRIMGQVLDEPSRFSIVPGLTTQRDPVAFVQALLPKQITDTDSFQNGTGISLNHVRSGFALNGQFFAVVGAHIPMPQQLVTEGVTPGDYYQRIDFYLGADRAQRPAAYADIAAKLATFDPAALVADLNKRIVSPTLAAGSLFASGRFPSMTRLYTTLSPEDMNADPVFSFNPSLRTVSNIHRGSLSILCSGGGTLKTDAGFEKQLSQEEVDANAVNPIDAPASWRRETLLDTGPPMVVVDNTQAIRDALGMAQASGCTTSVPQRVSGASYLSLCALAITTLLLRRRRRIAAS